METAEEQRILRERDDLAMMKNPDLWPAWPILPLKNRESATVGFLLEATDCKFKIFLGNFWKLGEEGYFESLETKTFDSFEAIIAEGWHVD